MTGTALKNLKLARMTLVEKTIKEAIVHYKTVYAEMPDNLEAEWFSLFGSLQGAFNEKTVENYTRLAEIFYPTLEYIATLEEGVEKQTIAFVVIKGFLPLHESLHDAMLQIMLRDSTAISTEDYGKLTLAKKVDKEKLADDIIRIFGDDAAYGRISADIWKEMIAKRFRWSEYRHFQDRGKELWFDELAKKIKKYDPSYEMPQFKQAGCITSGDAARIKPGE